ncbi:hypothetical protein KUV85_12460 [Nocardioides panacisoli]|uniref:sirohydrochlorin chelatase n=1 Tax=Nocardioides panacisoli TaxID=627624 RepID=UPI001C63897E|nr:CbiX/SirB N-terminal domain-containing protein [Nocardioides panacisoli]QYJ03144.1 hypothetical protein KUV85_12460 [Nocardioides panacisoli]
MLITVAHGTRQVAGNEIAVALTAAAAEQLGEPAVASYVELCDPLFEDVVAGLTEPAVAVPLLLSTGYHVRADLPRMAARAGAPVTLGGAFGPHALLAAAQVERLREAGAAPGTPVVMVAAGSREPAAMDHLGEACDLLAEAWGSEVRLATLGGLGERPDAVVRSGDVVSPYLLSPGFFLDRARDEAHAAGATVVADVLGVHPLVVDLVCQRAGELRSYV